MKTLISALCSLALMTFPPPNVGAKSYVAPQGFLFTVNTTDDHNDFRCDGTDCTLREAIQAANNTTTEDTIDFSVTGVINLASALPDISNGVTIEGPGANLLTVRCDSTDPFIIFDVTAPSAIVRFSGLTISDGAGGILNLFGSSVIVTNSVISGNSTGAFGVGAGIRNGGTVAITNSTIDANFAMDGGGIYNFGTVTITNSTVSRNNCRRAGGGIFNAGTVTITNSTIARNGVRDPSSRDGGGGIFNESGTLTITNTTVARNGAPFGGGILNRGPVNIKGSIIAAQVFGGDVRGDFNSAGFNMIGMADGSTGFTAPTDLTGTIASPIAPGFETDSIGLPLLKDNGGPTQTIALLSTSPAIDKGTAVGLTGTLSNDQRGPGFPRTVDNPVVTNANGGDGTDIGAFELQPPPINSGNSLLINESCPPANAAIDPGERVTVNLELMNTSNAATSNLVATLQTSGGVIAPSGPQSYGAIATNGSAARDFSFTAEGSLSSGQTITATLQLQDGATSLGTVSFNFTAGPTPCSFVRLVVTSSLSRTDASTVVGALTVQNIGSLAANNVVLTTAKLGATNGTPLPQSLGNLAPGASASVTVNFNNSTPGTSSMLTTGGTYAGGTFSSNRRVTVP